MENILTLIAAPNTLTTEHTAAAANALGTHTGRWLGDGEAWEALFASGAHKAEAAARKALGGAKVDVVVQPAAKQRKRLLVADMDFTIIEQECLDVLAERAGVSEEVAALTRRAMAGEIDFAFALAERVALLAGQPESLLEEGYDAEISLRPGARTVVATMRAGGATTALVSGGFRFFTERVAAAAGCDEVNGNNFEIERGFLTGRIDGPVAGAQAKLDMLKSLAAQREMPLAATLAVGDGANDIPMLRAAGLGVAVHAKPVVRRAAVARLEHAGLVGLLYLQGYNREEFVEID